MGCFSPDAPPQPNYGQITRDTLQAQVDLAPQQYAAEAQFQPKYSSLELSNLNTLLNGVPGGPQSYTSQARAGQTGWYDASGKFLSPGDLYRPQGLLSLFNKESYRPGAAPAADAVWHKSGDQFDATGTRETTAQPGLFGLLQQQNTDQRTADITDVADLGPKARAAMLAANPDNAALLAKLNAQANEGLDAGSMLTADEQRAMSQESRAAFAARGMGGSNPAVSDELLRQFNLGQTLLRQRQAFAQSVLGNNQSVIGDPFSQILGRNSGAIPAAYQGQSQAGPSLFNPQAGLGLAASNYATTAQFDAGKPSTVSNIGSIMGLGGKLIGGVGSAMSI